MIRWNRLISGGGGGLIGVQGRSGGYIGKDHWARAFATLDDKDLDDDLEVTKLVYPGKKLKIVLPPRML